MTEKKFALRADQIKALVKNRGGCFATDMITVEGRKVGYMYRQEPRDGQDSGWVFMAGQESQAYMDDAANHGIYDVNTIANYDPDVIPFLDAPAGTAFERQGPSGRFAQVEGEPWKPGTKQPIPAKKWPPPGFPIVEGDLPLTANWSIFLPERFARRVEDGALVLWRPGLTIWLRAWNNDHGESRFKRLAAIKKAASPERFAEHESEAKNLTRYSYRLLDESENGPVESLYGFVIGDDGQLELAIYFDNPTDEAEARQLVESVVEQKRPGLD
ncbi:MAG TPA: DUF2185 domain-containing protein [Pirellulales bacterium]|nr:DUF2185 domain-containing protein [Pirellulales bacterium]